MSSRQIVIGALTLALLAAFAYGINEVLRLRVREGDVYPPYSTFRADPRGTRALYEALAVLPGYRVSRNTRALTRLTGGSDTTLILAGAQDWLAHTKEAEAL